VSSPHDTPFTFVHDPGNGHRQFTGPETSWHPDASPIDPHDEPFTDVTGDLDASKVDGPLPSNIIRSGPPGPFSRSKLGL
jgi:hypothetical protein